MHLDILTGLMMDFAGHCKRLAPTWAELGEALKDNPTVKIAHVDCTVDRDVCTKADVSTPSEHTLSKEDMELILVVSSTASSSLLKAGSVAPTTPSTLLVKLCVGAHQAAGSNFIIC